MNDKTETLKQRLKELKEAQKSGVYKRKSVLNTKFCKACSLPFISTDSREGGSEPYCKKCSRLTKRIDKAKDVYGKINRKKLGMDRTVREGPFFKPPKREEATE